MFNEGISLQDTLEFYKVDSQGNFTQKVFETCNNPSLLQIIKRKLGLCNYANDILMNEGLVHIASWLSEEFNYMGVGGDITEPSVTTFHNVKSPLLSRVLMTTGLETTYVTDDTTVFVGTWTNVGTTVDLYEAGVFKDATTSVSDVMLCRQTYAKYTVTAGESFGIIWKVICARG